jgi:signal transduction histidine kinase
MGAGPQVAEPPTWDDPQVSGVASQRGTVLARTAAVVTAVVVVSALVPGVVFDARAADAGRADVQQFDGADLGFVAGCFAATVVACSLLVRRPRHPVGWCFAGLAVAIAITGFAEGYALDGLEVDPGGVPAADVAALFASTLFIAWFPLIGLVCALTPDGRFLSPRWRHAGIAMVTASAAWFVLRLVSTQELDPPFEGHTSPWAVDALDVRPLRLLVSTAANVLVLVAVASLAVRFRRSRGDDRRQLLWFVVAAVVFVGFVVVAFVGAMANEDGVTAAAAIGLVAVPPIGAWLSIVRYRLYDVDRILSRAVAWLVVSLLMAATYAVVVVVVARAVGQAAGRSPTAIVLATLAVVAAIRPVHGAVQDAVDRRFARRRHDAVARVRAFVADPTSGASVEAALAGALGVDGLRVAYPLAGTDQWVTEDGLPVTPDDGWRDVTRSERTIARVQHASDPSLLDDVLRVAAPELDNARLRAAIAVQLQEVLASRRRIAQAQVDERRRIERDLHDGAQQRLLGAAAQLQAALLNGEPSRMRAALELGTAECRAAVVELRELANGLHPSALADGGLAAALEQLPQRFPITTVVNVPGHRYPPDVESTLWFVTCEALTNAVKHAHPSRVEVHIAEDGGALRVIVDDDGCGGADAGGHGLRGLADRVEAVGGRLVVAGRDGGGTRVEAVVPCGW